MATYIAGIAYHLPKLELTNERLAAEFPDWTIDKIQGKTGICSRRIAAEGECASDLGVEACRKLFSEGVCQPGDVDFLLFCTQSPDYFLPTTACLMQQRLGIPTTAGALDFNLGCSGYIYGLGLAKGLIESGQARRVLLVTAETYSKHIHPGDKSVRTLFGDAAAATLIASDDQHVGAFGPFVYGTDGRGGANLCVPSGGMRLMRDEQTRVCVPDDQGNLRSQDNLYMNGPEIFTFTLREIPGLVRVTLAKAELEMEDIDHFVFHQANQYMLESLRKKTKIPESKFILSFAQCGNTVSSTIPIALKDSMEKGLLKPGERIMLVGFGVGYSWGSAIIQWQ